MEPPDRPRLQAVQRQLSTGAAPPPRCQPVGEAPATMPADVKGIQTPLRIPTLSLILHTKYAGLREHDVNVHA
jgi:hypothetical protein